MAEGDAKVVRSGLSLLRSQRGLFEEAQEPLELDEYQNFTSLTDKNDKAGIDGLPFTLLGIFGETGSLLSALKKKQRDKDAYVAYRQVVVEEMGDVLWYFANAALRAGLDLSTIAGRAAATLDDWSYSGSSGPRTFRALQTSNSSVEGALSTARVERRLIALAGRVGNLLEDFNTGRISANGDILSADLVEIFRTLISAADDANVSLDDAAQRNIAKAFSRWPAKETWLPLYDEAFDQDERLPRQIVMQFKEKDVGARHYVIQQCNGLNVGDRLTDNRLEPDDYRFHDVFHLAYAAILGWSPVLRALFRVKRKSRPETDENEDGARATLIEEGVATLVFNHGVRQNYFANVRSLDYDLLNAVNTFVMGYEVEDRPLWQWERAILEGFRLFREMRRHRGGDSDRRPVSPLRDFCGAVVSRPGSHRTVTLFLDQLAALHFDHAFNPYTDLCVDHDLVDAPTIRRRNLDRVLTAALAREIDSLWLGCDLGYRGGRRTGLAFTDEMHLQSQADLFGTARLYRATKGQAVAERTATVVWRAVQSIRRPVFLWNVFPLHPHEPKDALSNRQHSQLERAACAPILWRLLEMLRPKLVVAIGRDAQAAVASFGIAFITVRHPSHGGQSAFLAGIERQYATAPPSAAAKIR